MPLTIVPGRLTQIPGQTYSLLAIFDLDTVGAAPGDVPTFNGTTVVWASPGSGGVTVAGGTGIAVAGGPAYTVSLDAASSPTLTGLTLSGLAASSYVRTNGASALASQVGIPLVDVQNAGGAAGDLTRWNGTNWIRLPIGTAGQILTVSAGVPTWAAAPAGVTVAGGTGISVTGGPAYTVALNPASSPTFAGLTVTGLTANTYVRANGASALASQAGIPLVDLQNAAGAAGDILFWNGTNWVRLAKGLAGTALIIGATNPAWGTNFGSRTLTTTGGMVASTFHADASYSLNDDTATESILLSFDSANALFTFRDSTATYPIAFGSELWAYDTTDTTRRYAIFSPPAAVGFENAFNIPTFQIDASLRLSQGSKVLNFSDVTPEGNAGGSEGSTYHSTFGGAGSLWVKVLPNVAGDVTLGWQKALSPVAGTNGDVLSLVAGVETWTAPSTQSADDLLSVLATIVVNDPESLLLSTAITTVGATERLDVSVTVSATTSDGSFAQLFLDVRIDSVSIGETSICVLAATTAQIPVCSGGIRLITTVLPGAHTVEVFARSSQPVNLGTNILIDPATAGSGQHASLVVVRLGQ